MVFEVDFYKKYLENLIIVQDVGDSVDWLNYYASTMLLAFFALLTSTKQYFGSPIQCFTPAEFEKSWEKYAESYCFVNNMYHVPWEITDLPNDRSDKVSYYRWVPFILAFQAFMFYLPNHIWNALYKQTAINPKSIVKETQGILALKDKKDRDERVKTIAKYITQIVEEFSPNQNFYTDGHCAFLLYLSIKFLYLLNCFGQLFLMEILIGNGSMLWGWDTFLNFLHGKVTKDSVIFPRVIMCDFTIRTLANNNNYTVQCVIMMNMFNEKIFLFFYFWFWFVGIVTFINFLFHLVIFFFPKWQNSFVLSSIMKKDAKTHSREYYEAFATSYLKADGILLLKFIRQYAGGRITFEIVNKVFSSFKRSIDSKKLTPNEKAPSLSYIFFDKETTTSRKRKLSEPLPGGFPSA